MISLSELIASLKKYSSVAVICHVRPDGDTIGSALALSFALNTIGISANVFCDDAIPTKFNFINGVTDIMKVLDKEYSAMVAIDCADIDRLGNLSKDFIRCHNTFVIDHHISNPRFAKTNYVVDNASNCENVYDVINEMGIDLTSDVANALALGIMTDTGAFKHKNLTSETLIKTAKLKEKGADINKIYYEMFVYQSSERAYLFGKTMSKIKYFYDKKLAVATVMLEDINECGAKQDETEGFIDFVMGIRGVEVGVCIMQTTKEKFKISFRSKSVDVNAVASTFGGGGHTLASGCQIQGEYEEVLDKVTLAVKRELPDII